VWAAVAALVLAAAPALARSDLDQRITQLREQNRLDPDATLAQLHELDGRMAAAPPLTRAAQLVEISAAQRLMQQKEAALDTAEQIIRYGSSLHNDAIIAQGLMAKAMTLRQMGKVPEAHQLALDAEKLAYATDDSALQVQATTNAGMFSSLQGNFLTAADKLQAAIRLAGQVKDDPALQVQALIYLTLLRVETGDRDKAYAVLAELQKQTAPLHSTVLAIDAKTMEYTVAQRFGDSRRALQALLDNLALERQLDARRLLVSTEVNLSNIYLQQHDYSEAARHASEALRLATVNRSAMGEAKSRMNLGHAYLGLGRRAEGKQYYEAGLAWLDKNQFKPDLQQALMEYGQALEEAGDMAGAVQAYHRERTLSDEMTETQRRKSLLELEQKYETESKQRQIELLRRENQMKGVEIEQRRLQQRIWWLLALIFALASAVIGLLYRKVYHTNAQLEVKNTELKALSTLDPLTSLYNRRHFLDYMRSLPATALPGGETTGALFLLDIDHFKQVNDSYGHTAGDAVLKMVAEKLRIALRETDMIVRWGGEEFLAFLPAIPRHGIDEVAHRILAGIASNSLLYQGQEIAVRVSIGFAPFPLAPDGVALPWERAVNLVDMALYLAKAHGRNRAYGLHGFGALQQGAMEAIEQDLESAWRSGLVELRVVQGDAECGV